MKNLFDFATKELSQDAFLRWLLENWNDPDVGDVSLSFIETLTGLSLKREEIEAKDTRSRVQQAHMDICFDIYTKENKHYLVVIEDKTESGQHDNQLDGYNETIENWRKGDKHTDIFKLYYKTSPMNEDEIRAVKEAGWKLIDFDEVIFPFFERYVEFQKSDILRDYARHIVKIKKDKDEIPSGDPATWNFTQWGSFFDRTVKDKILASWLEKTGKPCSQESWSYQGRLMSYAFYCHQEEDQWVLLEFVVRPGSNEISGAIHLSTRKADGSWTWKKDTSKGDQWQKLRDKLAIEPCKGFKKTRTGEKQQTLATLTESIAVSGNDLDAAADELWKVADNFIDYILVLM